jgi:monoamine oxidase
MKTTKTPLLAFLRKAYRIAKFSKQPGAPPIDEILAMYQENHWTRRRFLENTSKAAILATIGGSLLSSCKKDNDSGFTNKKIKKADVRIGIVGGGIAGLHALHILRKSGVANITVFESNTRTGGRIMSVPNVMGAGLVTEFGGEFIDSTHEDMLSLASEFGLTLLDTQAASETALNSQAFFFEGQHYTLTQVISEFSNIAGQMQADIDSLSESITYNDHSADDERLDQKGISEYLTDINCTGWLKKLLEVAYETEYGLATDEQSAVNLLFLISTDTSSGRFDIFGESDERYKISGGNQQVVDSLANLYPSHLETGRRLVAVDKTSSEYLLYFDGMSEAQRFDFVIITVPFSVLRNVEFRFDLPAKKQLAIDTLGYGTNAKLMLGFNERTWRNIGYTGYLFSDNGLQTGWDNSQLQPGMAGGFTVYTGGQLGLDLNTGTPEEQAAIYLPKLEQIFPGTAAAYNNTAVRMHWPSFPHALGSYACYKVGQFTTIAGAEQETYERLFFAGEHCSLDYQGFMNGGAATGREAAEGILTMLV